jgi:hypothetical protein
MKEWRREKDWGGERRGREWEGREGGRRLGGEGREVQREERRGERNERRKVGWGEYCFMLSGGIDATVQSSIINKRCHGHS